MLLAEILSRKWALDSKRAERIASDARKAPPRMRSYGEILSPAARLSTEICRRPDTIHVNKGFQRRSAGGQARFIWTKSGWGSDGRR